MPFDYLLSRLRHPWALKNEAGISTRAFHFESPSNNLKKTGIRYKWWKKKPTVLSASVCISKSVCFSICRFFYQQFDKVWLIVWLFWRVSHNLYCRLIMYDEYNGNSGPKIYWSQSLKCESAAHILLSLSTFLFFSSASSGAYKEKGQSSDQVIPIWTGIHTTR